jgi:hypothetical protein
MLGVQPSYTPPARSLEWSEVFQMAVTQPNTQAYETILNDPQASTRRAYVWIIACATIAYGIQYLGQLLWGGTRFTNTNEFSPLCAVVCLPFVGVLSLVGFLIGTGIQHLAAKVLGGKGDFDDMVYLNAAWTAPLSVVSAAISLIPCISCFGSLVSLYGLVLSVITIRVAHRFETGRALLAIFWWLPLLCLCVVIFVCLLGPAVGNVFQNIMTEIATQQP